ncbi:hypothetical protein CAP36_04840 [Chitinophagaceae bacterium IBVUCB2]|nr:hypothetical protein CAP36_04840 [Chitinophagaceae bacterium IBVUCB2]
MKKMLILITSFIVLQSAKAQVIRDNRKQPKATEKPPTALVTIKPEVAILYSPQVMLYEHANFSGQNKTFGVGDYRFFGSGDFNDLASSIKVPNGLVVVIYEHANENGGYGNYVDLLEDCPDLSVYNFSDKASYLRVFSVSRPGYIYVRNRVVNNQFVPGHWERVRADGTKPDNSLPAVTSSLSQTGTPDDYTYAPLASQAELDEFNDLQNNQLGVGILGGETTKPFYYHHNQAGEEVYKYNKVIDPSRLPGAFFDKISQELGWAGVLVKPLEVATELAGDIKDWLLGSSSTKVNMDCWFPVSEFKKTVCGTITSDTKICGQDYIHTKVTIDKDVCIYLKPSERFRTMLTNRWTNETSEIIEGEVKAKHLANFNTQTQKSTETLDPHNPLLLQIKKDANVCLYGPWMGDILDLNVKVPVPFSDESIALGNIDLRKNNEIHPVNQLWRKTGNEIQLTAIVDGTGYFQKIGNNEVAASGLYQRMQFYIAFSLPGNQPKANQVTREFTINGVAFDFTEHPILDVQPETLTFKYKGNARLVVNNNSFVRNQKTHKVFFDKVRTRADGSVQGYIVVETEPITKPGGSINIFVKDETRSSTHNINTSPVKTRQ